MVEKPSKVVPALVGGVILGLLSAIPVVNFGNACCCLWVLVGGAIAAKMLINRSPVYPVQSGDGAVVGALAGVIGSLVNLVIGVPLGLLVGQTAMLSVLEWLKNAAGQDPNARAQIDQMMRMYQNRPFAEAIVQALLYWLIGAVVTIGFAALGGLIGVLLFEKRKGGPPQGYPPPPGYPPTPPPPGYPPQPPPGAPYGGGGSPYGGGGAPYGGGGPS
jgi:hypothetical protein